MWRSYVYPSRVNSKKYLLVTHYVQNETRTKPELSVGISNKTVQNRLGRRMVRRLSGLFERKQAAECKLGGSGSGLRPGRTGWQCTSSDLETSEMTPICGLNNSERWQTVCWGKQWVGVTTGFGWSAFLKGRRRAMVRRGRWTKRARITGWERITKRGQYERADGQQHTVILEVETEEGWTAGCGN